MRFSTFGCFTLSKFLYIHINFNFPFLPLSSVTPRCASQRGVRLRAVLASVDFSALFFDSALADTYFTYFFAKTKLQYLLNHFILLIRGLGGFNS